MCSAPRGVARAGKLGAAWFKHHRDRRQRGRSRGQGPRRRDRRAGGENGADPRHPEAAQRPRRLRDVRRERPAAVRGLWGGGPQVGRRGRPAGGGWDLRTTARARLPCLHRRTRRRSSRDRPLAQRAAAPSDPRYSGRLRRQPVDAAARAAGSHPLATPELPEGPGSARGGSSVTGSAALLAGERLNRCAHLLRQCALKGGGEF